MRTEIQTPSIPPAAIIVADARPRVRATLKRTIAFEPDMRVVGSCETSQETWRSLRQRSPEILLLDWTLPDTGAMTLLRRLHPGPDLNVILLTDERNPEVLVEAMLLGARGAVSVSSCPETLVRCARSVLSGELWFSRSVTRVLRDHILSNPPRQVSPAFESVLTPREMDVVRAISRGLMNQEIANELGISAQTVRHHLKSIFAKLGLSSRLELALLASKNRL